MMTMVLPLVMYAFSLELCTQEHFVALSLSFMFFTISFNDIFVLSYNIIQQHPAHYLLSYHNNN